MTAFDYVHSRETADRLLTKFGQAVSLRRETKSGSEIEPTVTIADYDTKAAIVDYNVRQIDGANILATDRRALIAAGPLVALGITSVAPPDKLVVGGVAIPLLNIKPVNPAGTVVMWDCTLRL